MFYIQFNIVFLKAHVIQEEDEFTSVVTCSVMII